MGLQRSAWEDLEFRDLGFGDLGNLGVSENRGP